MTSPDALRPLLSLQSTSWKPAIVEAVVHCCGYVPTDLQYPEHLSAIPNSLRITTPGMISLRLEMWSDTETAVIV